MSRRKANDRHIRIRAVRRDEPDIRRLSRALIALAQAQLEKEAEASHDDQAPARPPTKKGRKAP